MEMETKLVIVADDSARLADEIAALTRLGRYLLVPRANERLHDTYWDRQDGRLGAERLALRLRRTGSKTLITLKGPAKIAANGAAVRMEIEEAWSPAALAKVRLLLTDTGLWPAAARDSAFDRDPAASLRQAGFDVVQDRETERQPRNVLAYDDPRRTVVAELAIDITAFHLAAASIINREIEVESKGPAGKDAVEAVTLQLLTRYPRLLSPSDYSKLAMGKAIEATIDKLLGGDGIAPDGALTSTGHALVNKRLRDARP